MGAGTPDNGVADVVCPKPSETGEAVLGGAGGRESRFGGLGSSGSEFSSDITFERLGSGGGAAAAAAGGGAEVTGENALPLESSLFGGEISNAGRRLIGEMDVDGSGGKLPIPKIDRGKAGDAKALLVGDSCLSSRIGFRSVKLCCG